MFSQSGFVPDLVLLQEYLLSISICKKSLPKTPSLSLSLSLSLSQSLIPTLSLKHTHSPLCVSMYLFLSPLLLSQVLSSQTFVYALPVETEIQPVHRFIWNENLTSSPLSPTLTTRSSSSQGQQTSAAAARASRAVRPPHQQQPRPAAAARASRAVRPPHQQQPRPAAAARASKTAAKASRHQQQLEPPEQSSFIVSSSDADISSSLSSDYQAAILHDSLPKDKLTTPQHCPRRSSLSASADAPFTQVQTSRDRLDLEHCCSIRPTSKLSP
ncbi:unnamed protein product [Acanthosepion pharaonis]|uniref:Uncharacterized protein n=1 Tax=Acanthosepion pharaonis TaxID=158019 RepID=A0A812CDJ8_ACAPH|nr:unnamed protein product [Sepia pharaonis]